MIAALVATYAFIALLLGSRFGHALAGIRVNEQRMRAAGFSTTPYKLAAFVIAGALAGLAGLLLAIKDGAVNPELLSWHESGAVLLMLIFGGIGSLRGAVIGAIAFTLLKELFQSEALLGPLASHWQLTLGLTIIAFVAALPRGLIGLGARLRGLLPRRAGARRRQPVAMSALPADAFGPRAATAATPLLEAIGLGRRFRGLAAVDEVSLDLCVGEIHAVIGTNGAGKSTLINLLSGELAPSAGCVRFGGDDVTRWSQPRRARAGLGRSYQRTTIFAEFSVLENCRLAAQAQEPRPWLVWERAADDRRGIATAKHALDAAGLDGDAGRIAVDAQPRRQAPARDRDVPGDGAARAAARRAARRHGRRRDRPDAGAALGR